MVNRILSDAIRSQAHFFPVISIGGPRQSGKTTLAKHCFPDHDYINLESPDLRLFAQTDPRSFLKNHRAGVIIDEAQYVPELFSYLQAEVDERQRTGEFVLAGSQNFLLAERISQSLAGRVALFTLLPFSIEELRSAQPIDARYQRYVLSGMYPRLWDKGIPPADYYPNYIQTYIERDVRNIKNISNLSLFTIFLKIMAGRAGQIMNFTSIANDVGVDTKTIQSWTSILEASYIVFLVPVFYKNYNKRLVKAPKLYFHDTGLLCSLLGIVSEEMLDVHPNKGNVFENFVFTELRKSLANTRKQHQLHYWRDSTGNEIDCIVDTGTEQKIVEIKSSTTIHPDFFKQIVRYQLLSVVSPGQSFLVCGDTASSERSAAQVVGWDRVERIIKG
jgi:predicted AAA+ superfamily ATPase